MRCGAKGSKQLILNTWSQLKLDCRLSRNLNLTVDCYALDTMSQLTTDCQLSQPVISLCTGSLVSHYVATENWLSSVTQCRNWNQTVTRCHNWQLTVCCRTMSQLTDSWYEWYSCQSINGVTICHNWHLVFSCLVSMLLYNTNNFAMKSFNFMSIMTIHKLTVTLLIMLTVGSKCFKLFVIILIIHRT